MRAFLKDAFAQLQIALFHLLASAFLLPEESRGIPLLIEVYRGVCPFLRSKYVSLGKQEAISTGLAETR